MGIFFISTSLVISDIRGDKNLSIEGKAPKGIEVLSIEIASHIDTPENKGSHGSQEYCYQMDDVYVVYNSNLLGHGYKLSRTIPKSLKCSKPNKDIKITNKLGMYIGMTKAEVEKLLNLNGLENNQTIIWLSEKDIEGKRFDLQTYVELLFKEKRLEWISVFTTTTR